MQPRNPIGLFHKKARAASTNEEDALHLRRVCSYAHNNPKRTPTPDTLKLTSMFTRSPEKQKEQIVFVMQILPFPAAYTMAPYSRWPRGSGSERRSPPWA